MTNQTDSLIGQLENERNIAQANHNDITVRTLERVIDMVRRHEEQDHREAKDFIKVSGKYEAILEDKLQQLTDIDVAQLLTDMRMQVKWSDKATMPIPLYERMKAALSALNNCGPLKDVNDMNVVEMPESGVNQPNNTSTLNQESILNIIKRNVVCENCEDQQALHGIGIAAEKIAALLPSEISVDAQRLQKMLNYMDGMETSGYTSMAMANFFGHWKDDIRLLVTAALSAPKREIVKQEMVQCGCDDGVDWSSGDAFVCTKCQGKGEYPKTQI